MTPELLTYGIRLTTIWLLLGGYYLLAFRYNRNWQLQNWYLLGAYLAGLLLPLLPALSTESVQITVALPLAGTVAIPTATEVATSPSTSKPGLATLLWIGFGIGSLGNLFQLLREFAYLQRLGWERSVSSFKGWRLIRSSKVHQPMAGFYTIFVPIQLDSELEQMALLHESLHLQQHHTYIRFFLRLSQLLFWWHPGHWWIVRQIEQVQEYQADAYVCQTFDKKTYGRNLLRANLSSSISLWPTFLQSPLKKRIEMLISKAPQRVFTIAHALGLLLLLSVLLVACTDLGDSTATLETASLELTEVDQPPKMNGYHIDSPEGEKALLETIYKEIRYPNIARAAKLEGQYQVVFELDETGSITIESIDERGDEAVNLHQIVVIGYGTEEATTPGSREEASRVMNQEIERTVLQLTNWTPAQKDGQAVPVRMRLWFKFKLQD